MKRRTIFQGLAALAVVPFLPKFVQEKEITNERLHILQDLIRKGWEINRPWFDRGYVLENPKSDITYIWFFDAKHIA